MTRRMISFCIRCLQFGFVPLHSFKDGTADIGIYGLSCIFDMGLQNILFVMGQPNLKLVSAYCNGGSAAHVSLDHNCAESTVHRALNRVREYLRMRDYDDLWRLLIDHIMEHSPNWGECEPEGILDMIYETYREFNVMDDAQTKAGFKELNRDRICFHQRRRSSDASGQHNRLAGCILRETWPSTYQPPCVPPQRGIESSGRGI